MKTYKFRVSNSCGMYLAFEYVEAETYKKAFEQLRQKYPTAYFTFAGTEACEVCE